VGKIELAVVDTLVEPGEHAEQERAWPLTLIDA